MPDRHQITTILREKNIIGEGPVHFQELSGGVSSDIWLVSSGDHRFVLKQALPQLKVDDFWEADVKRNLAEQDFLQYLTRIAPGAAPRFLYGDRQYGFFLMSYLGDPWESWKQQLLLGHFDPRIARKAAILLANIHNCAFKDPLIAKKFDHKEDFFNLRVDPYLVTTGIRNPALQKEFEREADRLMNSNITIVHGDFSPKNILVKDEMVVLLDHEVACFGDPAFDIAFFINHLMLKKLFHGSRNETDDLALIAWKTYFQTFRYGNIQSLKMRSTRLWLMLMLARVDGKSPVEYLSENQRTFIRSFVHAYLPGQATDFLRIKREFDSQIKNM